MNVVVGVGGYMKSSSHPSANKLSSVKEAQDAYKGAQTSMAAAQQAGTATRASINALQAKLRLSFEQVQHVAASEIPAEAVWVHEGSISHSTGQEGGVYSLCDVLEGVVAGQWPAGAYFCHVNGGEPRQLKDLVSEKLLGLLNAALSVSQELRDLRKQEAAHLCKAGVSGAWLTYLVSALL